MSGWVLYGDHDGRIRFFTVNAEGEDAAKLAIQQDIPSLNFLNFISKEVSPGPVIDFLGLKEGQWMEWVPAQPGDTISPRGMPVR